MPCSGTLPGCTVCLPGDYRAIFYVGAYGFVLVLQADLKGWFSAGVMPGFLGLFLLSLPLH